MSECEILKRKLKLKREAVKVIREEIRDNQDCVFLLKLRDRLSTRINGHMVDRELSSQLDCVTFLIESLGKRE